jgi:hypothetical protein
VNLQFADNPSDSEWCNGLLRISTWRPFVSSVSPKEFSLQREREPKAAPVAVWELDWQDCPIAFKFRGLKRRVISVQVPVVGQNDVHSEINNFHDFLRRHCAMNSSHVQPVATVGVGFSFACFALAGLCLSETPK